MPIPEQSDSGSSRLGRGGGWRGRGGAPRKKARLEEKEEEEEGDAGTMDVADGKASSFLTARDQYVRLCVCVFPGG